MEKLAVLLAAAAAIVVALYLILARRPMPTGRRGGRLGARFALMVTGFVWLLGGCRAPAEKPPPSGPRGNAGSPRPASGMATSKASNPSKASKASRLSARAEWKQLQKAWLGVPNLKITMPSSLKPVIANLRAASQTLTDGLVKDGLLDKDGAQVFNDIYADRVYHQLRPLTASCYDPTALGSQIQLTRTVLEKRLKLISGFARAGKVKPAVAQKVEASVARALEILLLVKTHWDKVGKGNRKAYQAEERRILSLFAGLAIKTPRIKGTVKIRPGVPKAMQIIKRIYSH
jgi:hypothetical protein